MRVASQWIKTGLKFFPYCLAFPFVLMIRLLRPLRCVRFVAVWPRLGHAVANTHVFWAQKYAGKHSDPRIVHVFYPLMPVANRQVLTMWKRVFIFVPGARWVARLNNMIPGGKAHYEPCEHYGRDVDGLIDAAPVPVSFTVEEEERGQLLMAKMGIPAGSRFVCLHMRDDIYLKQSEGQEVSQKHDFRDSSIVNFVPAVQELVRRGYWVIRMGNIAKDKFPWISPQVVDYPFTQWPDDFADVYLVSKCSFFVGTTSGVITLAQLFKKSLVMVDFIPLGHIIAWSQRYLTIPKKLFSRKEGRFLRFKEILNDPDMRCLDTSRGYVNRDIDVIANTAQEIRDVVVEMEDRLNGRWQTTDQAELLQRTFWGLYQPDAMNRTFCARLGTKFLLDNSDLLD